MDNIRVHDIAEADARDATETAVALTAGALRDLLEDLDDDTELTVSLVGPAASDLDQALPIGVYPGLGTAMLTVVDPAMVQVVTRTPERPARPRRDLPPL